MPELLLILIFIYLIFWHFYLCHDSMTILLSWEELGMWWRRKNIFQLQSCLRTKSDNGNLNLWCGGKLQKISWVEKWIQRERCFWMIWRKIPMDIHLILFYPIFWGNMSSQEGYFDTLAFHWSTFSNMPGRGAIWRIWGN